MDIKDAVVLITGGAIRLGRAHGLHLAGKGAHIAFTYLPGEPWQETKQEIEALGVRCTATELDVRDLDAMRRWVVAVRRAVRSHRRADQQCVALADATLPGSNRSRV